MNQQKGFSLIEVLVSLMLVTTLALALLDQQWQTRQFINQLQLHVQASGFLDHVNESLTIKSDKLPNPPAPFQFSFQKDKQNIILGLNWFKKCRNLTRRLSQLGAWQ